MEWSNIRMSKAEFERLQKEYAEAAIRTAEKARLSYDADEPVSYTHLTLPTNSLV